MLEEEEECTQMSASFVSLNGTHKGNEEGIVGYEYNVINRYIITPDSPSEVDKRERVVGHWYLPANKV